MTTKKTEPLCDCVERSLDRYFDHLNGEEPSEVYAMVLAEVERPLLEVVMKWSDNSQTRAARILGINRNTLRKNLRLYGLEE